MGFQTVLASKPFAPRVHTATARCLLAVTVLLELSQVGELELPFLPSAKSLLYFTCQNQSNSVVVVFFN